MLNSVEVEFLGKWEKRRVERVKSRTLSNIQSRNLDLFEIKNAPFNSLHPSFFSIVWCLVKCRVAVRLPVVVMLVVKSTAPNPNAQSSMNHCSPRQSRPLLVYARVNASQRWFKVSSRTYYKKGSEVRFLPVANFFHVEKTIQACETSKTAPYQAFSRLVYWLHPYAVSQSQNGFRLRIGRLHNANQVYLPISGRPGRGYDTDSKQILCFFSNYGENTSNTTCARRVGLYQSYITSEWA